MTKLAVTSSSGTTFSPGCSQEHPDLKKIIIIIIIIVIYIIIKKKLFFYLLKKIKNTLK